MGLSRGVHKVYLSYGNLELLRQAIPALLANVSLLTEHILLRPVTPGLINGHTLGLVTSLITSVPGAGLAAHIAEDILNEDVFYFFGDSLEFQHW